MRTFYLKTFGCKQNQYESQGIREVMQHAGWQEAETPAQAEVCILSTCTVTTRANRTCRNAVRQAQRENPSARIFITGCAVDTAEAWLDDLPGIDAIVPNAKKHQLPALIDGTLPAGLTDDRFAFSIHGFAGHTRAFVKIQDGCDNFCSYCIIPYARGKPDSRPLDAILDECRALLDAGHRELILTGISIGAYDDGHGNRLADVLGAISTLPGLLRLRTGSIEPIHITSRLLEVMAESDTICPHIHLPLQTGDDRILQAMNRKYSRGDFLRIVETIRAHLTRPAITTDIIVGFPGEGEEEFANTFALCETAQFSRAHIFLFSPRPGTPAAELPPTSTDRDIAERKNRLIALCQKTAADYAQTFVGEQVRVLVEEPEGDLLTGYTDRYLFTRMEGPHSAIGSLQTVRITGAQQAELCGTCVE